MAASGENKPWPELASFFFFFCSIGGCSFLEHSYLSSSTLQHSPGLWIHQNEELMLKCHSAKEAVSQVLEDLKGTSSSKTLRRTLCDIKWWKLTETKWRFVNYIIRLQRVKKRNGNLTSTFPTCNPIVLIAPGVRVQLTISGERPQ